MRLLSIIFIIIALMSCQKEGIKDYSPKCIYATPLGTNSETYLGCIRTKDIISYEQGLKGRYTNMRYESCNCTP